jgi:UDP-N-acetylmuramyl tripeptide synthase
LASPSGARLNAPDARLALAIAAGKSIGAVSRALRLGGGTTLPGRIASAVDPSVVSKAARALPRGSLVLTGTNGKTTTARLLADMLRAAGLSVVHNRAGANLISGVASAIVAESRIGGTVVADVGLFEVDEAATPDAVRLLIPKVVVITNLFRDQLDRYGELDYLLSVWREALSRLPPTSVVVLNADDPAVASLADGLSCGVKFFGIDDADIGLSEREHASDSTRCPRCARPLAYSTIYYSHLGNYLCHECGLAKPSPDIRARSVRALGLTGTDFLLGHPAGENRVTFGLPGLYNVYNALAASAAALAAGIDAETLVAAMREFKAAFGRIERIPIGGRDLFLALVKNPVGFNQVIRTIAPETPTDDRANCPLSMVIAINDHFADGTDISWLWDVDFERLAGRVESVVVSGTRADDMALRLKYAGVDTGRVTVINDGPAALAAAVEHTPAGQTCYVLPTYTAMLELRTHLANLGLAERFWEN